jgi:hypothetical protein
MKNRKDISFLTKTKKARGESQSRGAALGASHSDLALDGVETCATPQSKPPQEGDKQGFGGAADPTFRRGDRQEEDFLVG